MQRQFRIGDWVFEVTQVKARKVKAYGEPFTSIATLNLSGSVNHIDGLLAKNETTFSRQDFKDHVQFAQQMQCDTVKYTRYHNGKSREVTLNV